jgi:hypothetical protein
MAKKYLKKRRPAFIEEGLHFGIFGRSSFTFGLSRMTRSTWT